MSYINIVVGDSRDRSTQKEWGVSTPVSTHTHTHQDSQVPLLVV